MSPLADPLSFPVPSSEGDTRPQRGSSSYTHFLSAIRVEGEEGSVFFTSHQRQQFRSAHTAATPCCQALPGAPSAGHSCLGQHVRNEILRANNCAAQQTKGNSIYFLSLLVALAEVALSVDRGRRWRVPAPGCPAPEETKSNSPLATVRSASCAAAGPAPLPLPPLGGGSGPVTELPRRDTRLEAGPCSHPRSPRSPSRAKASLS